MADIERIYTIPLIDARKVPRWKRAESAVRKVRIYLAKHLKTKLDDVKIDKTINEKLWERGSMKPPLKVRGTSLPELFVDSLIDLNIIEKLWERGSMKPPLKVRVRAVKFEAGGVQAELA